jgi:membrane AbrB-like protein
MQSYLNFGLLLLVAVVGGFLGSKLKLPGATLMGAMLAVIIFKAFASGDYQVPRSVSFLIQIIVGMMVGISYSPEMGRQLVGLAVPILASTMVLVLAGLALAVLFAKLGFMNIPTAYLSTSPGGMSALIAMALESDANPTVVVAFHFFRVVLILLSAPFVYQFLRWWLARHGM